MLHSLSCEPARLAPCASLPDEARAWPRRRHLEVFMQSIRIVAASIGLTALVVSGGTGAGAEEKPVGLGSSIK